MKKSVFIYIHQGILKGGVEKVFHTIINNLPPTDYSITVLSVMGYLADDFESKLYPKEVKRYCLMWDEFSRTNIVKRFSQKLHNRFFPWYFKQVLKFRKFDIAIAAQEGLYAKFVIDNVTASKKFLWIHNDIKKCHWTQKQFDNKSDEAAYYRKFDNVVCVSQSVAQSMNELFGKMDNLCVCHNPIDTTEIETKLQATCPPRPDCTWFLCVGRLALQKGFDRLVKVCKRLNDEGYKYQVTILGEGDERQPLEILIKNLEISNIHLAGNKDNPFIYMKSADWFLQTSRHEGFGLALYESAYCGTPIITTDVAGAKELLGNSEYGIITENSEIGIYHAMKSVLDNPDIQLHYKNAIKKRASLITLQKRIEDILRVINR